MDALDRTFRHLVQTIQARYPAYLTQSFEVADVYQNILPYRHHRRDLGLETNQDYELVLLQLLSGARDYLIVDDTMRERLARELASPNPDAGAFREFSTTQIALSPAAVRQVQEGRVSEPAFAGASRTSSSEPTQRITAQRGRAVGATSAADARGAGHRFSVGAAQRDSAGTAEQHDRSTSRRPVPLLQRLVARGTTNHLLPSLRAEPHDHQLPGLRDRAGARLEVLHDVRSSGVDAVSASFGRGTAARRSKCVSR